MLPILLRSGAIEGSVERGGGGGGFEPITLDRDVLDSGGLLRLSYHTTHDRGYSSGNNSMNKFFIPRLHVRDTCCP